MTSSPYYRPLTAELAMSADEITTNGHEHLKNQLLPDFILPDTNLLDDPLAQYISESEKLPKESRISCGTQTLSKQIESSGDELSRLKNGPLKPWDPLLWRRRRERSSSPQERRPPPAALNPRDKRFLKLNKESSNNASYQDLEILLNRIPNNRKEALTIVLFLKKRLIRVVNEVSFYKDKVTVLQSQLIQQNAKEEELIKIRNVFNEQSLDLQKLQTIKDERSLLRKTIQQQELIISRLEEHVKNDRATDPAIVPPPLTTSTITTMPATLNNTSTIYDHQRVVLENEKLRQTIGELSHEIRQQSRHQDEMLRKQNEQLAKYQEQLLTRQLNKQSPVHESKSLFTEADKYELYRMLDRAESRIKVLEAQLDMRNRPIWGPLPLTDDQQGSTSAGHQQSPENPQVNATRRKIPQTNHWRYTNIIKYPLTGKPLPEMPSNRKAHGLPQVPIQTWRPAQTSANSDPVRTTANESDLSEKWLIEQLESLDLSPLYTYK